MKLAARALAAVVLGLPLVAHAAPTRDECIKASEDAQLLRLKGQLVSARDKLVVCGNDMCPKVIKKDCGAWLDEVERSLPTIVVGARDPSGKDLVDVQVTLDGQPFAQHLEGRAVPVDPGNHTLHFQSGADAHDETIVVREGEKARVVSVTIGKATPQQVVVEPPKLTTRPPEVRVVVAEHSRAPSVATWIVGGVGLATLVATGIVGTMSLVQRQSLYDSCGSVGACKQSDVDAVYTLYNLSYAGAAIGGAFLVAGVVLFFTTRPSATTPVSADASGLRIRF